MITNELENVVMTTNELENGALHSEYITGIFAEFGECTPKRLIYRVKDRKLVVDEYRVSMREKRKDGSIEEHLSDSPKERTVGRNPLWDRLEIDLISLGAYGSVGALYELFANHLGQKMTDIPGIVGGGVTMIFYLAGLICPSQPLYP